MPVVARSVVVFDPQTQRSLLPQLVNLHAACIEQDNTIATFLPPLNHSKMLDWWSQRADEVAQGTRDIVMCYVQSDESQSPALGGFVTLAKPPSDTGPFRATVEKLLVSPAHRRLGIAKLVMEKVEELAAEKGRTMITLDTVEGSPAEFVYPRLGYIRIGVIPDYGISPKDGSFGGAVLFYKHLEGHATEDPRRGAALVKG